MQGDELLQKWKEAKLICQKVILISKQANILNSPPSATLTKVEYMSVYDVVYNLCLNKEKQQKRLSMVYREFKQILKEGLLSMCQDLNKERDICKLEMLRKIWNAYMDSMKRLLHMFAYLNRPFHIKEGKIQQLEKTGIDIIFFTLFNQLCLKEYQAIYFKQLQKIRHSQKIVNEDTLKSLINILYSRHLKLGKYAKKQRTAYTDFHALFSQNSRQHYSRMFRTLKELSPCEYFKSVHQVYQLELAIAENCFGLLGETLFSRQFSQQLMQSYKPILLTSPKGLKTILRNKQVQTLKIIIDMYRKLTKNVQGFRQQFQEFVYDEIKQYMVQLRTEILVSKTKLNFCNFMEKLIRKNKQFLFIMEESFTQLGDFVSYYKSGVEKAFIDTVLQVSIEEILAFYVDTKLKSSTLREDQLGQQVRNILHIFTCLQNKDLFLKRYIVKLAKRMISSNDPMTNHETFINNLKLNCGMKFTQRLQTLMSQLAASRENQKLVDETIKNYKNGRVRIAVGLKVFAEGAWPTQNLIELPNQYLPDDLQIARQALEVYRDQHSNKKTLRISYLESKIRWVYYFQKQAENPLQQCYFDTNCLQGSLLYYIYSQRPKLVQSKFLEQYFEKVQNKQILKQNLDAMTTPAEKILLKTEPEPGQVFYQFNSMMKSRRRLINYDSFFNEEEEKLFRQQQDLTKDRELIVDANVSKYMKSRKLVPYEELENEILKMIKVFVPGRRDIKSSVDRLISKQILIRDAKNINIVKYVD